MDYAHDYINNYDAERVAEVNDGTRRGRGCGVTFCKIVDLIEDIKNAEDSDLFLWVADNGYAAEDLTHNLHRILQHEGIDVEMPVRRWLHIKIDGKAIRVRVTTTFYLGSDVRNGVAVTQCIDDATWDAWRNLSDWAHHDLRVALERYERNKNLQLEN